MKSAVQMKIILALVGLTLPLHIRAEEKLLKNQSVVGEVSVEEENVPDPVIVRALDRLEKRMEIRFNIPFPANYDIDVYRKRPIALISLDAGKVCATRPIVNPYDEPRAVEWMIGPADPAQLQTTNLECAFDLDDQGDFCRVNLLADWATDDTGNHQIERGENESGSIFFERARLTYQMRAKSAKDPATAMLFLSGFEKMATVIQSLREEEARAVPSGGSE
jgi:hypothetical protein